MNLPNKLTLLRMLLVPVIGIVYYFSLQQHGLNFLAVVAAVLFVAAAFTDLLDGAIARKRNSVTLFGKFMDPIADKLLVTVVMVLLTAEGALNPLVTGVFIAREFIISGFRLIAAADGVVIAAGSSGKLKTIVQDVMVVVLMLKNWPFSLINVPVDDILIYVALLLTVYSLCEYLYVNRSLLKSIMKDTK